MKRLTLKPSVPYYEINKTFRKAAEALWLQYDNGEKEIPVEKVVHMLSCMEKEIKSFKY